MLINDMVVVAYNNSQSKGFWDDAHPNIAEKLCLIHSEISEALEDCRLWGVNSGVRYEKCGNGSVKPVGFAIELADAVIRIADLCGYLGIDLQEVIRIKMEYNATRPHKHGKAF